jgi:Tfp pilus assembly protein PilE
LTPTGTGTCHIVATAAGGATSSAEVTITAQPIPCGSDPSGCGTLLAVSGASDDVVTLGGAACADAGAADASDGAAP